MRSAFPWLRLAVYVAFLNSENALIYNVLRAILMRTVIVSIAMKQLAEVLTIVKC
jgi:hypothetical protein